MCHLWKQQASATTSTKFEGCKYIREEICNVALVLNNSKQINLYKFNYRFTNILIPTERHAWYNYDSDSDPVNLILII